MARVIEVTWTNNRGPHKEERPQRSATRPHSNNGRHLLSVHTHICSIFIRKNMSVQSIRCFEASRSDLRSCCAGLVTASVCPGTASVHATASCTTMKVGNKVTFSHHNNDTSTAYYEFLTKLNKFNLALFIYLAFLKNNLVVVSIICW